MVPTIGTAEERLPAPDRSAARELSRWPRRSIRALGFWGAIALPVAYPSFLVPGVAWQGRPLLFVGLVGVHLLALFAGRGYRDRE